MFALAGRRLTGNVEIIAEMSRLLFYTEYEVVGDFVAGSYWLAHTTNATWRTLYDQVASHSGYIVYTQEL